MAKKQYFCIIDTETTLTDKVADFGIVVCDRKGNIHHQAGILINGIFGVDSLFYDKNASNVWSTANLQRRIDNYNQMLQTGSRMLASVNAINRYIEKIIAKYNPTLTAYNLAFDVSKCQNTGIDLNGFSNRFCLWHAAVGHICHTKAYRQFVLNNHLFNKPTENGNMTYSTNAENVTAFLNGQVTDEPHTSIEDIIGWELPILKHVVNKKKWQEKLVPYDWKKFQVNQHYKVA